MAKCSYCEQEHFGNFCPNCGVPIDFEKANLIKGSMRKEWRLKDKLFVILSILAFLIGIFVFITGMINVKFNNLEQQLLSSTNSSKQAFPKESEKSTITKDEEVRIALDELITVQDKCEFFLSDMTFSRKIAPPNAKDFYTYYEIKDPELTYLDVVLSYRNLESTGIRADDIATVKIIYDNKYEYPTFSTIEEKGGSNFTYTNITNIDPLKTETIHFLCEVPQEVEGSTGSVKVILRINNTDYICYLNK